MIAQQPWLALKEARKRKTPDTGRFFILGYGGY
jgi:hypothetical protein